MAEKQNLQPNTYTTGAGASKISSVPSHEAGGGGAGECPITFTAHVPVQVEHIKGGIIIRWEE